MARRGRVDRGLVMKRNTAGKPVWYVRIFYERRDRTFEHSPTKTRAREFYEKIKKEQREGIFFPERYQRGGFEEVQAVIDRYWLTIGTVKPTTRWRYQTFATWWKRRFTGQRVNAITSAALEDARRVLLATVVTPANVTTGRPEKRMSTSTVNRYVSWLRSVLNMAVREGKLASNPATTLTIFKESAGKTRFLSVEEEAALLRELGPEDAKAVRVAILTGMRQREQFSLRWADVDLERGLITLTTTKAGGVQYVTLNDEAVALLRSLDSWARSAWVYPSPRPWRQTQGKGYVDPASILRRFRAAVQRAKLAAVTWYDLRHTFASRLAMNGQGEGTISALLRHSTTALVCRYAHLSPSHLKMAVEGVSTFGKRPATETVPAAEPNGTVSGTVSEGVESKTNEEVSA